MLLHLRVSQYAGTQWRHWGDRPGRHHPGGDTRIKLILLLLNLERTLDKRLGKKMGVVRRRQLKKVITFQRAMTKKRRQFFQEKIG